MGNQIGLEIDNESVKVANIESSEQHVEFIRSLNSKYLRGEFAWRNSTVFLFQCTIAQFLEYHNSTNVELLREKYQNVLGSQKLVIKTNRATINKLKSDSKLYDALHFIMMRDFQLQHRERISTAIDALRLLQNKEEFFNFSESFKIVELHNFNEKYVNQVEIIETLPNSFLVMMLRNGTYAYQVEGGEKLQRINGSIIGEKTILSILKFRFPEKTLEEFEEIAFKKGNLRTADLMVQDIYGKNCFNLGLPGDIIASSLGKVGKMSPEELEKEPDADIVRSIFTAFAINTAKLTSLFLKKTGLTHAVILTDILHFNEFYCLVQSILSSFAPGAIAIFSKHAPFIGCLGAAFQKIGSEQQMKESEGRL